MTSSPQHIAQSLALAVTTGQITDDAIVSRSTEVLGTRWRWLRPLARRLASQFAGQTRPRKRHVYDRIIADAGFRRACQKYAIATVSEMACQAEMSEAIGVSSHGNIPSLTTLAQLAAWVDLPLDEMLWLADQRGQEASTPTKYRRYRYCVLSKGSRRFRLLEIPIYRLKLLQRRLLDGLLNQIDPHNASHGFRIGRSIHSFAADHTGRKVVLKLDLQDCFATINFGRVSHLFRRIGYPERVADNLAAIATNIVPNDVWDSEIHAQRFSQMQRVPLRYTASHLPQGAPTSPAIANLCLFKLDLRLAGLANTCGATYSRYADDMAFSGDGEFEHCVNRARHHIAAIIEDEGFRVNHRKTRIMRASTRQCIAGIVVNQHANVQRREYDRLKAILHNCRKYGIASQNRDGHVDFAAHLAGRVSFFEAVNPDRGRRLRKLLNQIES